MRPCHSPRSAGRTPRASPKGSRFMACRPPWRASGPRAEAWNQVRLIRRPASWVHFIRKPGNHERIVQGFMVSEFKGDPPSRLGAHSTSLTHRQAQGDPERSRMGQGLRAPCPPRFQGLQTGGRAAREPTRGTRFGSPGGSPSMASMPANGRARLPPSRHGYGLPAYRFALIAAAAPGDTPGMPESADGCARSGTQTSRSCTAADRRAQRGGARRGRTR